MKSEQINTYSDKLVHIHAYELLITLTQIFCLHCLCNLFFFSMLDPVCVPDTFSENSHTA